MSSTQQFQIKPDFYNTQEECLECLKKRINTNTRYLRSSFNQTHFTAGDEEQFNYYRQTEDNKEIGRLLMRIPSNNVWKNMNHKFWDKYKNLSPIAINNTFLYIFHKFKKGIFIKIKNNKLEVFLPFSKVNYTNEWHSSVSIDSKFNNINEIIKYCQEAEGRIFEPNRINLFMNKWYANNCLVRFEYPLSEGDSGTSQMKDMFTNLCNTRKIPDIEFFVNRRDFPLLTTNETEPYNMIYGKNFPLCSHNYTKYAPILSMVTREDYADVAIPTWEDWERVSSIEKGKFFPKSCKNYNVDFNLDWESKKNIAMFRGGSTGPGINIKTNPRLHVAHISSVLKPTYKGNSIIDAGITNFNMRPRLIHFSSRTVLTTIKKENLLFKKASFLSQQEQSNYKYIINIPGHSAAFRLGYEMKMGSCILLVDTPYKLWFRKYLIKYKHFIPIKADLSDLIEKIKWCIDNDDKCKIIAQNALEFYNKYLNENGVLDFLQGLLCNIKKEIGVYLYTKHPLTFQEQEEKFILENLYTFENDKEIVLNEENKVPIMKFPRNFSNLKAVELILNNSNITNINLTELSVLKETKSVIIKSVKFLNKNNLLLLKTLKINKITTEFLHSAFVGLTSINNLSKKIPNFMYTFMFKNNDIVLENFLVNKKSITFNDWLLNKHTFNINHYVLILVQLSLALHIAQNECSFTHYDLFPWNIIIVSLEEEQNIEYRISTKKTVTIKTNIMPVIIDYGKSSIVYNNKIYGYSQPYKLSKIQDIVSILVSSMSVMLEKQDINYKDITNIITLANYLKNTSYTNNLNFKRLKDIKIFAKEKKKYSDMLFSDKGELESYNPIHFFEYIISIFPLKDNIIINSSTSKFINNIGYAEQVVNYILAKNDKERIKSYKKFLIDFNKINVDKSRDLIYNYYKFQQNYINIVSVYLDFITNFKEDSLVTKLYEKTIKLLEKKYKPLITNVKPITTINFYIPEYYLPINLFSIETFQDNKEILRILETYMNTYPVISSDYKEFKNILDNVFDFTSNDLLPDFLEMPEKFKKIYTNTNKKVLESDTICVINSTALVNTFLWLVKDIITHNLTILEKNDWKNTKKIEEEYREILKFIHY